MLAKEKEPQSIKAEVMPDDAPDYTDEELFWLNLKPSEEKLCTWKANRGRND